MPLSHLLQLNLFLAVLKVKFAQAQTVFHAKKSVQKAKTRRNSLVMLFSKVGVSDFERGSGTCMVLRQEMASGFGRHGYICCRLVAWAASLKWHDLADTTGCDLQAKTKITEISTRRSQANSLNASIASMINQKLSQMSQHEPGSPRLSKDGAGPEKSAASASGQDPAAKHGSAAPGPVASDKGGMPASEAGDRKEQPARDAVPMVGGIADGGAEGSPAARPGSAKAKASPAGPGPVAEALGGESMNFGSDKKPKSLRMAVPGREGAHAGALSIGRSMGPGRPGASMVGMAPDVGMAMMVSEDGMWTVMGPCACMSWVAGSEQKSEGPHFTTCLGMETLPVCLPMPAQGPTLLCINILTFVHAHDSPHLTSPQLTGHERG